MQNDTISYDSLDKRPLPRWLADQKAGLTTIQPGKIVMRDDNSLRVSFICTSVFILFTLAVLTVYFLKKQRNQKL
jgi:hypothetical protein